MGIYHVLGTVKMVPNRANRLILQVKFSDNSSPYAGIISSNTNITLNNKMC